MPLPSHGWQGLSVVVLAMRKFILILLFISPQLNAQQVVTAHDGVQLNWSQLRLTFSGTAQGTTLAELEEQAWQQGFQHLKQVLPHIYAQHYPAAKVAAQQVAARVFRQLQLWETAFFTDRRVQLTLSSSLANLFAPSTLSDDEAQLPPPLNSGLVLRAMWYFSPRAVYEIRGKGGQRYFDVSMVQEKHFRRNLMGRYFRGVTAKQLTRYVGRQPRELVVREISPAVLEVDDRVWQEFAAGNAALLAQARVAFIFPAADHN